MATLSGSHQAALKLISNNVIDPAKYPELYYNLGEKWAGPAQVKFIIEKLISENALDIYLLSDEVYRRVLEKMSERTYKTIIARSVFEKNGLILFPTTVIPIDLDKEEDDEYDIEPDFDCLFFSATNSYDYFKVFSEPIDDPVEFEEDFPEASYGIQGTLSIVPVNDGFVNLCSSYLWTMNELYLTNPAESERISYGNVFDFMLTFLYLVDEGEFGRRNAIKVNSNEIILLS
jgi:hypothetical protein